MFVFIAFLLFMAEFGFDCLNIIRKLIRKRKNLKHKTCHFCKRSQNTSLRKLKRRHRISDESKQQIKR